MAMIASCGGEKCPDKNRYTIKCTINDAELEGELEGEMVYLRNSEYNHIDSALVRNGGFVMEGCVNEPWIATLVCYNVSFDRQLVVEAGTIVVTADSIGGTPLNDKLHTFLKSIDMSDLEAVAQECYDKISGFDWTYNTIPSEVKQVLDSLESVATSREKEACWKAYHENGDNIVGVFAMETLCSVEDFTYPEFDSIVKAASPLVANSEEVQATLTRLHNIDATSVGRHYTDLKGQVSLVRGQYKDGKLSDLIKGKLALVDFYASWCTPCCNEIKENLVPLWNKYKDQGLVIVGLNVWEYGDEQDKKAAHKRVMKELGITYPQLMDTTMTATETYVVSFIPHIMLIGPDGTILARDLRGDTIETAIIEALKK